MFSLKRIVIPFLLMLSFNSFVSKSQALKIMDLIKFHKMEDDDLNDLLVVKGWIFVENRNNNISWALDRREDKANAWFQKMKQWNGEVYFQYTFCNTKEIGTIKSEIFKLGFRKSDSESSSNSFFSKYENSEYIIKITYNSLGSDDPSCDSYTVILEKAISLKERLEEERRLEMKKRQDLIDKLKCSESKKFRLSRNLFFGSKVDSFNTILENEIINSSIRSIDSSEIILDSIVSDYSIFDTASSSIIDTVNVIPDKPLFFGRAKENIFVYEYSNNRSKVKSGIFKNEKVKVLYDLGEFYFIEFDFCNDSDWDSYGYVLRREINVVSNKIKKKVTGKFKSKKNKKW